MPVLIILVGVAVLVGVFLVATGRGGELAYEHADHAPLDLGPVSATDVALLRPPTAMWGYNMHVTDEALERIAQAMRERDVRIAYLQQQLADLIPETAPMPEVARLMPEVPRSAHEVPRSAPEVLRSVPEVPRSAPEVPRSVPEIPRSAPEVPRSHIPQHARPADQGEPLKPADEAEERNT